MQSVNKVLDFVWPQQLVSEQSAQWIFECFAWAVRNFDRQEFFDRSKLVQPSNQFFPGNVSSVHGKAENIFNHSLRYAGLSHWPFQLVEPADLSQQAVVDLQLQSFNRNSVSAMVNIDAVQPISVSYNPQQTLKPEDLSANFAHLFSQHLLLQSRQLPPGGETHLLEASEVLAVFMGFGVLMANSAYTFRGGCGSCFNPAANRKANLTEAEVVFALALFAELKGIPKPLACKHLKKHLRSSYTIALRQIAKLTKTWPLQQQFMIN
ncbi:MAG: hypothetical protein MJK10_06275 [Pseudomonadales bacterium]|nr:hypothetical protein [Pseudomonadales bacterium]NRA14100.1 hypothetical protein [Oceanospirillaceae bacterium]